MQRPAVQTEERERGREGEGKLDGGSHFSSRLTVNVGLPGLGNGVQQGRVACRLQEPSEAAVEGSRSNARLHQDYPL